MDTSDLHATGLDMRREVLGHEYVDAGLAGSDDFMMAFQDTVTELAWGYSWSRPGLDRRSRIVLTLGILAGLGRHEELGIYAQGAVRNGITVEEIKEILIHVTSYCGTPAGRQSFRAVHDALGKIDALPKPTP
ncbi:MAG TPA: carboxymuconolactone decarboxylase family protein [Nocardioidaceae bacterium]|nr:carboxymuconolactone decarboxylase family protein [Nocardioidaceae bacterium]